MTVAQATTAMAVTPMRTRLMRSTTPARVISAGLR